MEVRMRVEKIVDESKRQLSLQRLLSKGEDHKNLLSNQMYNGKLALSLLEFIRDSVIISADKGITAQRKNNKHHLRGLKIEIQKKELDTFREMHHKMGDLIQRKTLYSERLQKSMVGSWQLTTLYTDTYKELQEQIEDLKAMQRKAATDFEPTEHALRSDGVVFVHPSAEEESDTIKEAREAFEKNEIKSLDNIESTRLDVTLSRATLGSPLMHEDERIPACLADGHQVLQQQTTANLSAAPCCLPALPAIDIKADLDACIMSEPPSSAAALVARRLHTAAPVHSPEPTPPPQPRGKPNRKKPP
eukprot:TRINITY_DN20158_c0_g1_i1.p1 TRINITY_DN20158_c0_g1~~TRINITY_DN20158_c0_g1_i1.p1  ORF type:complete len:304 (+),score=76.93 TRINITY_DN20158_c0_g1_i1:400-1311(+)